MLLKLYFNLDLIRELLGKRVIEQQQNSLNTKFPVGSLKTTKRFWNAFFFILNYMGYSFQKVIKGNHLLCEAATEDTAVWLASSKRKQKHDIHLFPSVCMKNRTVFWDFHMNETIYDTCKHYGSFVRCSNHWAKVRTSLDY